ncbi:MAG: lactonase family protein [Lachnospiraceae bacterium]|nr:lactonase family protein [Lachnospiraceae bacterium]
MAGTSKTAAAKPAAPKKTASKTVSKDTAPKKTADKKESRAGAKGKEDRYVAYVSTYTRNADKGIYVYDVDVEKGRFIPKDEVKITNSSYLTISHNGRNLYAITDFGVEAYTIKPDGCLENIGTASINGMRGCYLSTDYEDKYLFVAGYHDAKVTVLRINDDGTVGEITDEMFSAGLGSIIERSFLPHVTCAKMTRDNKYLCVCDCGMDQVKIYDFDSRTGKLRIKDMIRLDQDSSPRYIKFHKSGKFAYVIQEMANKIDIFSYNGEGDNPDFEKIGSVSTLNEDYKTSGSISCAMKFSPDHKYLMCSIAGGNSVTLYAIDEKTGLLDKRFNLPVSGDYPKDVAFFPDLKHIVSLNHESNTMSFLTLNLKDDTIVLNGPFIKVPSGNCIITKRL